jgi:hypothetical protein
VAARRPAGVSVSGLSGLPAAIVPLALALAAACPGPRGRPVDPLADAPFPPPRTSASQSGIVRGNGEKPQTFSDSRYPISIAVPEGWVAEVQEESGPFRVAITEMSTQTRVELWVFLEGGDLPAKREGCHWSFRDTNASEMLSVPVPVQVATCTPDQPSGPHILADRFVLAGAAYEIDVIIPVGRLAEGYAAATEMLAGVHVGEK